MLFSLFYIGNRQFNKYKNIFKFSEIAKHKHVTTTELLEEIIVKYNKRTKEEQINKFHLNKYWREPMAWH
jgi:hypothetical protein